MAMSMDVRLFNTLTVVPYSVSIMEIKLYKSPHKIIYSYNYKKTISNAILHQ